jgi:serine/threonine protein kinase
VKAATADLDDERRVRWSSDIRLTKRRRQPGHANTAGNIIPSLVKNFSVSLTSGSRLGPYEIVSPLGAGGMGEVYRARDSKLKRDVAVKVLPDAFVRDPDRLARFEREAQLLASLNHPNIAQIHGFENGGGYHALVMELVDGPTLQEILGPTPALCALKRRFSLRSRSPKRWKPRMSRGSSTGT